MSVIVILYNFELIFVRVIVGGGRIVVEGRLSFNVWIIRYVIFDC